MPGMCQGADTASRHVTPHRTAENPRPDPDGRRRAKHGCGPDQPGWWGPHPLYCWWTLLPGPRTQTERHITERPQRADDQADHDTDLDPLPHEATPRPDPPPQRPEDPSHSRHDGRRSLPETIPNRHNPPPSSLHPHNTRPLRQKSPKRTGAPDWFGREHPFQRKTRIVFALSIYFRSVLSSLCGRGCLSGIRRT